MIANSPYTILKQRKDVLQHTGYDYRNTIMKNSLSIDIVYGNTVLSTFVKYLNDIMYELIESVKQIKTFANFAMDKNERRFR